MNKQLAIEPTGKVTVLSVSPHDEDHLSLQAIIDHSRWEMFAARDLSSALSLLQQHNMLGPARSGAISAGVGRRQRRQPRWRESPLARTR